MASCRTSRALTAGRGVPAELAGIVAHCLEKSPEDRFQSARDLAFALQAGERETSGPTPRESGASRPPGDAARPRSRCCRSAT